MKTPTASSRREPPPHVINGQLNRVENMLGLAYLESRPRQMTIVLGNGCNIDCPHCYQLKNGDNLLRHRGFNETLRREFQQFYPFLSTLRIQGGEVFALKGFESLIEDVRLITNRPLISISTNGTLLSPQWCERIVSMPFQAVTFSFDAGTKATFERLRRGADFTTVMSNLRRIQDLKRANASWYPVLDAFFVVMRSNYREIPQFLDLMLEHDIYEVTFQTLLVDNRNLAREPNLVHEQFQSLTEIKQLQKTLRDVTERYADKFDSISWSGLKDLFESNGLDAYFLAEEHQGLSPGSSRQRINRTTIAPPEPIRYELPAIPVPDSSTHCSNPWSTLFITENGDVSLCFLSEPVANLYETPLTEIWNCPEAVAKRSRVFAGRYLDSGCSELWCKWRDGSCHKTGPDWHDLLLHHRSLLSLLGKNRLETVEPDVGAKAARRLVHDQKSRIRTLEANLTKLWEQNETIHTKGQAYIDSLEKRICELEQQRKNPQDME